jgi:hypothetical protein
MAIRASELSSGYVTWGKVQPLANSSTSEQWRSGYADRSHLTAASKSLFTRLRGTEAFRGAFADGEPLRD